MAKGQLANQLLGKKVKPNPAYGDPEERDTMNRKLWTDFAQKNTAGEYVATIQAVWNDSDGKVKALVSDPFGHMKEMWLEHVLLWEA